MPIQKTEYPEGRAWIVTRSDGALKIYILTREGNRGSIVRDEGRVLELRYNGKAIYIS